MMPSGAMDISDTQNAKESKQTNCSKTDPAKMNSGTADSTKHNKGNRRPMYSGKQSMPSERGVPSGLEVSTLMPVQIHYCV